MREVQAQCVRHFGWPNEGVFPLHVREGDSVEEFLDLLEIAVEAGQKRYWSSPPVRTSTGPGSKRIQGFPELEEELNLLFDRHRFGFRLKDGEVQRIGSPALNETVVGPALLAVQRQGWEEVERVYREAAAHQRGGEDEREGTRFTNGSSSSSRPRNSLGGSLHRLPRRDEFIAAGCRVGSDALLPVAPSGLVAQCSPA